MWYANTVIRRPVKKNPKNICANCRWEKRSAISFFLKEKNVLMKRALKRFKGVSKKTLRSLTDMYSLARPPANETSKELLKESMGFSRSDEIKSVFTWVKIGNIQ